MQSLGALAHYDFNMAGGRAESIFAEVERVVARWPDYADAAGVDPSQRDRVRAALRLELT